MNTLTPKAQAVLGLLSVAFGLVVLTFVWVRVQPEPRPERPSCENNWRLCETTGALFRKNNAIAYMKDQCQKVATKSARFGEPQWPKLSFEDFHADEDAMKAGVFTLIERDARFQNAYGASAHTTVYCKVGLATGGVLSILTNVP